MGGADQPFLYDPPSNRSSQIIYPYSDFNPRAATQAHYAALAAQAERRRQKAQQDGKPLINFNQHPDSYMVVANPTVDYEPMPANTKQRITWTRWVQFGLRLLQEIGALGILVCVICLKMKNDGPGWMIRVAPAWDTVITLYAIYHLVRPARGRTPSSSASYHFFALLMDAGLIPFYIFIALYANQNYNEQVGVEGRWTSFFSTNFATTTVIYATFLASIVMASLHLVSISIDLFLIVVFRKITHLPPDMNPLEDNLTGSSRRKSQKHKYKNSEMSVSTTTSDGDTYKRLTGSTLSGDDSRLSTAKEPEMRSIPFGHSRVDSDNTYSGHNPNSARLARQQQDGISLYQGPYSARSSRVDVEGGYRSRTGSVVSMAKNTAVIDFQEISSPSTKSGGRPKSTYPGSFASSPERTQTAPSNAIANVQQKTSLLNDNWYVLDDDQAASDIKSPPRRGQLAPPYTAQPTLPKVELDQHDSFEHQPLKMNPPTPPAKHEEYPDPDEQDLASQRRGAYQPVDTGVARTATMTSHATQASSVYSESAPSLKSSNGRPGNGTPKGKYYGDLASATRNIRGAPPVPTVPGMGGYGMPTPQQSRTPSPKKEGRVVSRTGADIADVHLYASDQQYGLRGRRDVSGKVAEEGRGGNWR